ncbi:hypothetical protein [Ruicaihuangia caeni]|uniref:hypothetical protein n=1 Tax=Ruicaihuangia caeni TaxID=3042517 RepID=UPI00338EAD0F
MSRETSIGSARFLALGGEPLNVNGDAGNAVVLAQRARWAGFAAELIPVALGEELPKGRPDAVVIGTFGDPAAAEVIERLRQWAQALTDWHEDGCFIIAAGAGLDALGEAVTVAGHEVEGLGILSGRATALEQRATDDLVIDSERFGRLVGFENHGRAYRRATGERALGAVVHGTGSADGTEGVLNDRLIATTMHGPLLAKNPGVADHVLASVLGDGYTATNEHARRADAIAADARRVILARLKLDQPENATTGRR